MCPNIFLLNDTWLYSHYIQRNAGRRKMYKEDVYSFQASKNIIGMSTQRRLDGRDIQHE
jgi:uncharacterized protein YraI